MIGLVSFSLLLAAAVPAGDEVVERRLAVMGTELALTIGAATREAGLVAGERAVEALEAVERRLSTWRTDSELARFNQAPFGSPFAVSPALAADLIAARRCGELTSGAFDPTVGALVAAWGLRSGGRVPSAEERARARAATGLEGFSIAADGTAIRTRPGLVLEEGGFGKGVGLAAALEVLRATTGVRWALVDLGGQVALLGEESRESSNRVWEVSVADPGERLEPALTFRLEAGSLATSGTSERGRHILDPRTGEPAADFGSLSVWTADPVLADCLSTGLYVFGPRKALEWAAEHPGIEVLALVRRPDGLEARMSAGLARRLAAVAGDVEVVSEDSMSHTGLPTPGPEGGRAAAGGDND